MFDGEYLKGKRNGKGKEYQLNHELIYEGEYFNGKRNGEGRVYYCGGILKSEGEYRNDKLWNGKAYDKNKEIIIRKWKWKRKSKRILSKW